MDQIEGFLFVIAHIFIENKIWRIQALSVSDVLY